MTDGAEGNPAKDRHSSFSGDTSVLEAARRLLELADKATPGPWIEPTGRGDDNGPYLASSGVLHVGRFDYASNALADKNFIAACRNDLPAVARALIRIHELLEKCRRMIELGEKPYRSMSTEEHTEYALLCELGINEVFARSLLIVAERMGFGLPALSNQHREGKS